MKTWKIPVAWTRAGVVTVEANTLAEAAKIAGSDDRFSVSDESKHLLGVWDVTIEDVDFIIWGFINKKFECTQRSWLKWAKPYTSRVVRRKQKQELKKLGGNVDDNR